MGMIDERRAVRPAAWVFITAGGVLLHFLVCVALLLVLVGAAYSFADSVPNGGVVGSRDELYKLGPAPSLAGWALAVVGFLYFLFAWLLLLTPRTLRRAWMAPAVGIALSVLIVVVAILSFQAPPPDIGG
jgi:cytochrome bd-type quinol oxidase subunit 2